MTEEPKALPPPRTEWQCVECGYVNPKFLLVCDDCGEPFETTRKADAELHGKTDGDIPRDRGPVSG